MAVALQVQFVDPGIAPDLFADIRVCDIAEAGDRSSTPGTHPVRPGKRGGDVGGEAFQDTTSGGRWLVDLAWPHFAGHLFTLSA